MWQIRYRARWGAVIAMWLAGAFASVKAQVIEKPPVNIQPEDTLL